MGYAISVHLFIFLVSADIFIWDSTYCMSNKRLALTLSDIAQIHEATALFNRASIFTASFMSLRGQEHKQCTQLYSLLANEHPWLVILHIQHFIVQRWSVPSTHIQHRQSIWSIMDYIQWFVGNWCLHCQCP